jgi:GT2 family glycosyltransferase
VANPDLVFHHGSVDLLVRFLDEHPGVGAVGPQFLYPDGTPQPSARRFPSLKYVLAGRRSPVARFFPRHRLAREFQYLGSETASGPVAVEALVGAFTVFRRAAFESVRGFDERYFMFAEDMDICRRLQEGGWRVCLDPRVLVEHYCGGVRRKHRRFTEYHRLKALCRFLCVGRSAAMRLSMTFAFACYLSTIEAGLLIGLGEYEPSWRRAPVNS